MMPYINIKKGNILVIGDVMLDCYFTGEVQRISPEAPVPIFSKNATKNVLGGAANVVANLLAAEQNAFLATIVGDDIYADILMQMISERDGNCSCIVRSQRRKTTVKTRLLAQNNQQLLRIDEEQTNSIENDEANKLFSNIEKVIKQMDLVLISDYLKGVLSPNLVQAVIRLSRKYTIPVFIDVKDKNTSKYYGATLLKPNRKELSHITGMPVRTDAEIILAAKALKSKCACEYILTTLGSKGMLLIGNDIEEWIPCTTHEVYDVSGAGDTVISYLVSAYISGYDMRISAVIASQAAGIKVTKIGTSPVFLKELIRSLTKDRRNIHLGDKRVSLDRLLNFIKYEDDRKIVFTNGCFDILHAGHISYLKKAAALGDILIVGLNSDDSVRRLKGENRPINNQEDRIVLLSALECVDYIVVFEEDTPLNLIEKILPDVLVKGADYKKEDVIGAKVVEENGGSVELIELLEGHSTTNIVNRMEKL